MGVPGEEPGAFWFLLCFSSDFGCLCQANGARAVKEEN